MDNTFLIKNICKIGSSKRIYADEYTKTGIPFFRSTEVIELANKKQFKPKFYISKNKYNEISQKFPIPQNNDILIAAIGANMGTVYFVNLEYPFYFKDGNVIWLRDFDNIINSKFLYYWLITKKGYKELCNTAIGSAQKALTIDKIGNIKIKLPSIELQQHIVDIIGSIDDKIENNQKLINKLDKILLLKFKKNYLKASKSNLTINLNSIVTLKTGKKDANASIKNGKYPFFTCSEKESSINVYSFDQEAILIAGNGNMSVKYYNGKFDAYQRTYVISSDKYFYYLYLYYKSFINDISIGAKGSVIKFLTKSLLLDIDLPILNDNLMNVFEQNVKIVLNYLLMLEKENSKLIYLKQLYLKKFFR